jgi:RNA recognition motif-containing protein
MSPAGFVFLGRAHSTNKEHEVKKLYVGNLSFETTEAELRALFEQEGEVTSVALITDRDTGRSRGFAFVEFATDDSAQKAIQRFNDMAFGGRNLRVNEAKQRSESRSGDRRNNRY